MSDELTRLLRELAETAETPPPLPGTGIRATAVRRRRRRRTTAVLAGGCAAATLAAVLTAHLVHDGTEQRPSPAASPTQTPTTSTPTTPPPTRATPYATVDLSRRVLTAAGRELPISSGTSRAPTPTGLMTVSAKSAVKLVSAEVVGFDDGYEVTLPWALELTPLDATALRETPSGPTTYIAATPTGGKAPGTYDSTPGWITLRSADAAWLYERLPEGAVIEIWNGKLPPPPTPAP